MKKKVNPYPIKLKCANCGLIYNPKAKPLPACLGGEPMPTEPEVLKYLKCVKAAQGDL